jgi:hypothetical protein
MVPDIIRDSPFGHIVRLVTRNKVFQYPEERDPSLWKKYVSQEKSGYMAHHGTAEAPEEESDELRNARGIRERESDEETQVGEDVNEASGVRIDPEKGRDKHVVDWYGPDDPAVRLLLSRRCAHRILTKCHCRIRGIGPAQRNSSSPSKSAFLRSPCTSAPQSTRLASWTCQRCLASRLCLRHWV